MVIQEDDHNTFIGLLETILGESNAGYVFLVDKSGQQIAASGDMEVDATSLASLTAGAVAATEGLSSLIGEQHFSTLCHEGPEQSLHISQVGERVILLVIFDEKSSLGLVRLRTQQHLPALAQAVDAVMERNKSGSRAAVGATAAAFAEISDEDIDALFG
jgi:predicted regulator of Ras-like GTPase activity (Roadblock/LC7/MglB family)